MNPSLEVRFRSMIRALTEVIIPALDPHNSLAQEQARLLIGHLHAALLQMPTANQVVAAEHNALHGLADTLLAASSGGPVTRAATAHVRMTLAEDAPAALAHALEALVLAAAADGSVETLAASQRAVLAHAKAVSTLGRTWFKPMGFDSDPASLPELSDLLNLEFTASSSND
jgi:hypothetical protein